jgi:hypothetical protein
MIAYAPMRTFQWWIRLISVLAFAIIFLSYLFHWNLPPMVAAWWAGAFLLSVGSTL